MLGASNNSADFLDGHHTGSHYRFVISRLVMPGRSRFRREHVARLSRIYYAC